MTTRGRSSGRLPHLGDDMARHDELSRLLDRLGRTNAEVAQALGVHERTIYKWLSGERPVPQTAMIALRLLVEREKGKR